MMKRISMGWFLAPVVASVIGISPAAAEPTIKETIAYYDVSGATPEQVRLVLNRIGPFDFNGRQFDAVTKWYVSWNYLYKDAENGCSIASATTEVKINTTMPRLKQDEATPAALRQAFDTYTANLLTHEKGHGQTGIDAAKRIEDGLLKLPAEPTCDRMEKVANEFARSLLKGASQQDVDYDAQTKHGATQGARFPAVP